MSYSFISGLPLSLQPNSPRQSDPPFQLQFLYEPLKVSLTSHSRLARLNTLRLLASPHVSGSAELHATVDTVKRCLQAEEINVDVQGVRERVLRIGRLDHLLRDGDELSVEVVVRWLVGK